MFLPEPREQDHPLRPIRRMTDQALQRLSPRFERMYADIGRPSTPRRSCCGPCCCRCSTPSAAGCLWSRLQPPVPVVCGTEPSWMTLCSARTGIAEAFFDEVLREAGEQDRRSNGRDAAGGVGEPEELSKRAGGAAARIGQSHFHKEKRTNETHQSTTDPDARLARKGKGKEAS